MKTFITLSQSRQRPGFKGAMLATAMLGFTLYATGARAISCPGALIAGTSAACAAAGVGCLPPDPSVPCSAVIKAGVCCGTSAGNPRDDLRCSHPAACTSHHPK